MVNKTHHPQQRALAQDYCGQVCRALSAIEQSQLDALAKHLYSCLSNGGTLYACGNGGSAATASHFLTDLAIISQQSWKLVALHECAPLLTALSNDVDYQEVFSRQIASLISGADILMCISYSGRSENIIRATRAALKAHAKVIVLTGTNSDDSLSAPHISGVIKANGPIEVVEDVHSVICHALTTLLREWYSKPVDSTL